MNRIILIGNGFDLTHYYKGCDNHRSKPFQEAMVGIGVHITLPPRAVYE